MPKSKLLKCLIDEGIITAGCVVKAKYMGKNLAGQYTVPKVGKFTFERLVDTTTPYLTELRNENNQLILVDMSDIIEVDGMDLIRLAETYDMKPDGTKKKVKLDPITGMPIRRGRKSKAFLAALRHAQNQDTSE